MARPKLPRALVIDRDTAIQQGGDVSAELLLDATHRIGAAVENIKEKAEALNSADEVLLMAMAQVIENLNNRLMSYFDDVGDRVPLHELAHDVHPRFAVAEETLQQLIESVRIDDTAVAIDVPASVNPEASRMIARFSERVDFLAGSVMQDTGPPQRLLDEAIAVYSHAQRGSTESMLGHLVSAESFVLGAAALADLTAMESSSATDLNRASLMRQLANEAADLSTAFDCGGRFNMRSTQCNEPMTAAAIDQRETVAA